MTDNFAPIQAALDDLTAVLRERNQYARQGETFSTITDVCRGVGLTVDQVVHVYLAQKFSRLANATDDERRIDCARDIAGYGVLLFALLLDDAKGRM